ncbi:MAG TPA: hypothetical protein VGV61_03220, partial [Thermoanaerobaculia bacterium]|nr:hypothetical protein [Thermoanaerobaculia bacterium]
MVTKTLDTAEGDLIAAFESCALPSEAFHHADHVRMAWLYLQRLQPLEALARFTTALQRFAAHHGAPERYHATITLAFFFLIAERQARRPELTTWEQFATANADLLSFRGGVLQALYREETLASDLARRVFVL